MICKNFCEEKNKMADADNVVTIIDAVEVSTDVEPIEDINEEDASQLQQQNGENKDKDKERRRFVFQLL